MSISMRKQQELELPAAGTWVVDKAHSTVSFQVRHLMIAKVRGAFEGFDATVHVGETPETSWVEATVDASTVNTGDDKRDGHLRSADFFDVERFPTWTFKSTALRPTSTSAFELDGDLTIHGETRPATLQVSYEGLVVDPWGNQHAVFSARTEIDREAFGLTWNQALEAGGVLVGKAVTIELEIQAVPQR